MKRLIKKPPNPKQPSLIKYAYKNICFLNIHYIYIHIYIYIYIILIIIKSWWQHRVYWLSLAIHTYRPLLLAGLLGCVQCPYRANVFDGLPTLAHPCAGVHKRTLLMSLSQLPQQWLACLVHLTWMVSEMRDKWSYRCGFVACCSQDLLKTMCLILV